MISRGYRKFMTGKQPWFTPRGIKIDIYTGSIPGVTFDAIIKNSKTITVGNKGTLRILGLESLMVAKHTAQRDQDARDLRNIAKTKLDIDWNVIQSITGGEFKTSLIKRELEFLAKT